MVEEEQEAKANYLDWAGKDSAARWRYLVASLLGFVLFVLVLPVLFIITLTAFYPDIADSDIGTILSFILPALSVLLLVKWLLHRPAWTVALPSWPLSWRVLLAGFAIAIAVNLFATFAQFPLIPVEYVGFSGMKAAGLPFILVAIVGLLVQTGAEELLFRGLLQQSIYRFTGVVWIAILGQALIFGALHIANVSAWAGNPLAMVPYVLTALTWGWVAWRTGSLLVPWMLHFVNNASEELIVGAKGDILHSVGPFVVEIPSITIVSIATIISLSVTVILVELYVRHLARRQAPNR